jgi:hypothetical protein
LSTGKVLASFMFGTDGGPGPIGLDADGGRMFAWISGWTPGLAILDSETLAPIEFIQGPNRSQLPLVFNGASGFLYFSSGDSSIGAIDVDRAPGNPQRIQSIAC